MSELVSLRDALADDSPWKDALTASVQGGGPGAIWAHPLIIAHAGIAKSRDVISCPPQSLNCSIASFAILREKRIRVAPIPKTSFRLTLNGYVLAGDQIVGCNCTQHLEFHRSTFSKLCAQSDVDFVLIENCLIESSLYQCVSESENSGSYRMGARGDVQPRWSIALPDEQSDYWSSFSSKTRYNLRRTCRRLNHEVNKYCVLEDCTELMTLASRVSERSWQRKRIGLRVRDDDDQLRLFASLANIGALRSYVLLSAGEPVAFMLGNQWNGVFVVEEIGYDPAYADNSPGTVLLVRALEDLLSENRPNYVDFGFGDAAYKRVFANRSAQAANVLLVSRRFKAQGTMWIESVLAAGRRTVKKVLERDQRTTNKNAAV